MATVRIPNARVLRLFEWQQRRRTQRHPRRGQDQRGAKAEKGEYLRVCASPDDRVMPCVLDDTAICPIGRSL